MTTNALIAWGIRFAATSYVLRFTYNSITEDLTFPATGSLDPTQDYFMAGDGQADDLMQMLEDCLNSHSSGPSMNVPFTGAWKVRPANLITMQILWDHANTTLDKAIWGFEGDTASGVAASSENVPQGLWRPQKAIAFDGRDRQPIVGGQAQSVSGKLYTVRIATPKKEREIDFRNVLQGRALDEYAASDDPTGAFEYAWTNSISLGRTFRVYPDEDTRTSSSYTSYRIADLSDPMEVSPQWGVRWNIRLPMRRV